MFMMMWFNNNIRCIEINAALMEVDEKVEFNNNIRCIEIYCYNGSYLPNNV